jgi:hypothetical protein
MLLLFVCLLAACSTAPSKEEVNKAVKKVMPVDFEVLSVKPLREVPGLNEVVVRFNKQVSVVYADRKGKFLVIGSVMEAATARNLTLETQRKFSQQ